MKHAARHSKHHGIIFRPLAAIPGTDHRSAGPKHISQERLNSKNALEQNYGKNKIYIDCYSIIGR